MTKRAPVWGYLGGPEGNGSAVAVYAPIVVDAQGQPCVWSGDELRPLRDPVGTPVDGDLEAGPNDVVVVVGAEWQRRLQVLAGPTPAVMIPQVPGGVWVTSPESARAFRQTAAEAALSVYDAQPDGVAKWAALQILRQDDKLDPVTRAVRVLDATSDVETYLTRVQVEARMTGLTAEALQERVRAYRAWTPASVRSGAGLHGVRAGEHRRSAREPRER